MHLRFSKTVLIWGASLVAGVSWGQTTNWSPAISSYLDYITKKDVELFKSLRGSDARRENQGVITSYYSDIRRSYLSEPFGQYQDELTSSLENYKAQLLISASKNKIKANLAECMGSSSTASIDAQIADVTSALSNYSSELQESFDSGDLDWKGDSTARTTAKAKVKLLDNIMSTVFDRDCCVERLSDQKTQVFDEKKQETKFAKLGLDEAGKKCDAFQNDREKAQKMYLTELKPPAHAAVPNPLSYDMDPNLLAVALRDAKTRGALRSARHGTLGDKDTKTNEDTLLQDLSGCIKNAESRQEKSRPTSTMVMEALGKAVKCTLLPAVATYYFDTPWQKLTVGATAVPIQGKDWNVNCDPSDIAMWDAMRETDPAKIQATWGIPAMANPPWIQGLRTMPPITTPFPVVGVTADDLIRASPQYQYAAPYGTTTTSTVNDDVGSRFRSGGTTGTTTRSSITGDTTTGSRFQTSSVATSAAPRSLSATGTASSRGQSLGRAFIQLTRVASSEIQRGKNTQKNTAQMASAARSTRNFFQATRQTVSTASLSAGRVKIASAARNLVSISAGSRASRTTSGQILGSISTISRTNTGSNYYSTTGTLSRGDQTAIGQQLNAIVTTNVANIQTAITAADALRTEMNKLIIERDEIVAKLSVEILDKAPMKIADKVMAAQQKLLNIDAQLGGLKSQWDVYDSSVREQTMFVQRALTYGPAGTTPAGVPSVNTFPDNYPAGLRGSTGSSTFFKIFDINEAWAAPKVDASTHWARELFRFVDEYADYAESRINADDKTRVQVAAFLKDRDRRVEAEPMLWMDTGTLLSARMFMGELVDESAYLVGQSTQGQGPLSLDEVSRANLGEAKAESVEALSEVSKATQELLKAHPNRFEDNSEVWVGMLPDLLLF